MGYSLMIILVGHNNGTVRICYQANLIAASIIYTSSIVIGSTTRLKTVGLTESPCLM